MDVLGTFYICLFLYQGYDIHVSGEAHCNYQCLWTGPYDCQIGRERRVDTTSQKRRASHLRVYVDRKKVLYFLR